MFQNQSNLQPLRVSRTILTAEFRMKKRMGPSLRVPQALRAKHQKRQ